MKETQLITHIKNYENQKSAEQIKVNSADNSLYYAILWASNRFTMQQYERFGTEVEFPASESDLLKSAGISHPTFLKSRERLRELNLIEYTKGYKFGDAGGSAISTYTIKHLEKCTYKKKSYLVKKFTSNTTNTLVKNFTSNDETLVKNFTSTTSKKFYTSKDIEEYVCKRMDTHTFSSDEEKEQVQTQLVKWLRHLDSIAKLKGKAMTPEQMETQVDYVFQLVDRHGVNTVALMCNKAISKGWDSIDDKLADDFNGQDKHQEKIVPSAHYIEN